MAMPLFESRAGDSRLTRVVHEAGDVAQWTAQLLAWLWLGQQGVRLGWPVASGVLAVVVWWAARVLCRGMPWVFQSPSAWVGGLGALTALGVGLSEPWRGQAALLALAAVWGVWSALMETRSQTTTFTAGRLARAPVWAAGLLALVWVGLPEVLRTHGCSALLCLCAVVLYVRDRHAVRRARACRGSAEGWPSLLAPSAMGVMMGSLWLGQEACMGPGWTLGQGVAVHVAWMAVLPALVAWWLPLDRWSVLAQSVLVWALIALGALMGWGDSPAHGWLAMLLPSLAWAVHCNRTRVLTRPRHRAWPGLQRSVALLLGPGVLLGVGLASPQQGPGALQAALAVLGVLAACALCTVKMARAPVLSGPAGGAVPVAQRHA